MSKTIEIAYPSGTEVVIMVNNNPVPTRIRAVNYSESLEISADSYSAESKEKTKSVIKYSTFAAPNKPLLENEIGLTKEELISKIFNK